MKSRNAARKKEPTRNVESIEREIWLNDVNGPITRGEWSPAKALDHVADAFTRFKKGHLKDVPYALAKFATGYYHAFSGSDGQLYLYEEGVYRSDGESVLMKLFQNHVELGYHFSTQYWNETLQRIKRETRMEISEVKKYPDLICLENGVLNWKTGKLIPHEPDYRFLTKLPVRYDPSASCDQIHRFLAEILPDERDRLKIFEIAGQVLSKRYYPQKFHIWLGSGSNGKGTLQRIFQALVGEDLLATVTLHELLTDRFASADLHGKHANIAGELDKKSIENVALLKMLTGEDPISAQRKRQPRFQFYNFATLIFSGNALPETKDLTDGFCRRAEITKFPRTFSGNDADPDRAFRLLDSEELSGFLNEAIAGLRRIEEQRGFTNGTTTEQARATFMRLGNPIAAFVNARIEFDEHAREAKENVYAAYVDWCQSQGIAPHDDARFSQKFRNVCTRLLGHNVYETRPRSEDERRPRYWNGINMLSVSNYESLGPLGPLGPKEHDKKDSGPPGPAGPGKSQHHKVRRFLQNQGSGAVVTLDQIKEGTGLDDEQIRAAMASICELGDAQPHHSGVDVWVVLG